MTVFPKKVENYTDLCIYITAIQWIETANDIVRGQIDIACFNHGWEAKTEVGITAGHYRICGAHVEVIPESATIGQGQSGPEAASEKMSLHLCTETIAGIKVVIAS